MTALIRLALTTAVLTVFTTTLPVNALTVTPGLATIGLTAHARLSQDMSDAESVFAQQTGHLQPITAGVTTTVSDAGQTLTTSAEMSATFLSAAHGRIVVSDAGWRADNIAQGLYSMASLRGSAGFSYGFSIDEASLFTITVDISADQASTDLFGLQGLVLGDLSPSTHGGLTTNANDPTSRVTITRNLAPGNFVLNLGLDSNIAGLPGTRVSLMDATVEWSIGAVDWTLDAVPPNLAPAPVPLPPALAMLGSALAAIFLLRARRKATRSLAP